MENAVQNGVDGLLLCILPNKIDIFLSKWENAKKDVDFLGDMLYDHLKKTLSWHWREDKAMGYDALARPGRIGAVGLIQRLRPTRSSEWAFGHLKGRFCSWVAAHHVLSWQETFLSLS